LPLQSRGVEDVIVDVLDANEENGEARRRAIDDAGLTERIRVDVGPLEQWKPTSPLHAVLLADVLHAQPAIDGILDQICAHLAPGAALLFVGRIDRGPIQISEAAQERFEAIWGLISKDLAEAPGLAEPPSEGDDGGLSATVGDAAECLQRRFGAALLMGFGHLADLVVGPGRGFALSLADPDAVQLLAAVEAIDQTRIQTESLPARHGIGVFIEAPVEDTRSLGLPWAGASAR
jgi:hypothetical protein